MGRIVRHMVCILHLWCVYCTYVSVRVYVCAYLCVYMCVCVFISQCVLVCIFVFTCMCTCVFLVVCVCEPVCVCERERERQTERERERSCCSWLVEKSVLNTYNDLIKKIFFSVMLSQLTSLKTEKCGCGVHLINLPS